MARVSQILGEQIFPERRLLLQSSAGVRHIALPGWLQAMLLAASLATVAAVAYLGVGFMHLRESLDVRGADATPAAPPPAVESAAAQPTPAPAADATNSDGAALSEMQSEVAAIKQQLAIVSQKYDQTNANYQQAESQLSALVQQNNQLQSQLSDANARLKSAQEAREEAERRLKADEQALNSKNGNAEQLSRNLENARSELQQSEVERTTLQNRVQQLQMDLQAVQARADQLDAQQKQQVAADPQRTAPAAAPLVPPVAPEAAQPPERKPSAPAAAAGTPHAENTSSGAVSEIEQLLASTGLDINRLLQSHDAPAEGGPYIALNDPHAATLDQHRLEDLQRLSKTLPLASPLNHYAVGSPFGARVDPINHRTGFHPGIDLDAPYETTVYSTGAGTVIFTGTMADYGRVVEIDHGHGIVTRYAHLHRILVAKGQKVGLHTPIGELGSTGRSTGPHLHYEVHVDGVVVDPTKFLQAGKNVVQVSGQQ